MNAAIIAVGSEMLGTSRLDTNSLEITKRLEEWGVVLRRKAVVGDDLADMVAELRFAAGRHDVLIVTGGLGPTEDDLTREAVAEAFGLAMEEDTEILRRLEARFAARGFEMPVTNRKQAQIFQGQETISNDRGTAPGFHLSFDWQGAARHMWIFPGVPHELMGMIESRLVPWLSSLGLDRRVWRVVRVVGLPESTADERLKPFYARHRDRPVTILASKGELQVHFYVHGNDDSAARLDEMEREVRELLGERVYGAGDVLLEEVVGEILLQNGRTVATAESCTGGMLAKRITDVPGSSRWFKGGVVAYTADSKMFLVGVDPVHIQQAGEVSEEVARDLALGARRRFGSDFGIGITGIAGPDGGSEDKPVGTVHVAVASDAEVVHHRFVFPGGRKLVRRLTTSMALDMLRRMAG
jgi:nicotinamide-nucleotide amidase